MKQERKVVKVVTGTIIRVNIIDEGKAVEILKEINEEEEKGTKEYIEKYFHIVPASTLSLEDEFLNHEPESENQRKFKERIVKLIRLELFSDFRAPIMDPSWDEDGNICYQAGEKPAVGKSADWWRKNAYKFLQEKRSRLGTTKERIAFLGVLIKYLIEEQGYTVSNAWKAVCDESKDLGHYRDSQNAKYDFELTGSRKIGEWYDLANVYKIVNYSSTSTENSVVGGSYCDFSYIDTLSHEYPKIPSEETHSFGVGWIILDV